MAQPCVPMSQVLFDYGVDIVGGAYAEDEEQVYKKILQGASPRLIKECLKTVLMPKDLSLMSGCEEISPVVKKEL